MKLSDYAKQQGIHYKTAHRWFTEGKIDGAYKSKSGSIFVENENDLKLQLLSYQRLYEAALKKEANLKAQLLEYQKQFEEKQLKKNRHDAKINNIIKGIK